MNTPTPDAQALGALLGRFKDLTISVIGDVMLDHYTFGKVERISPEAPVPVVRVIKDEYRPGGAANVALNLVALGVGKVKLIGAVGRDNNADILKSILAETGIDTTGLISLPEASTIYKGRVVAHNQQVVRIDREGKFEDYNITRQPGISMTVLEAMTSSQAIILSDYAKGTLNQSLINRVLSTNKDTRRFIALDPKPTHTLKHRGLNLTTPNRTEALQMAKIKGTESDFKKEGFLAKVFGTIHAHHSPQNLFITLSEQGMALGTQGVIEHTIPTHAKAVSDVSGAGDTVIATATAAFASGATALQAAQLANIAAGIEVGKSGTAVVYPAEILAEMGM